MSVYPRCLVCHRDPLAGDLWRFVTAGPDRLRGLCPECHAAYRSGVELPSLDNLNLDFDLHDELRSKPKAGAAGRRLATSLAYAGTRCVSAHLHNAPAGAHTYARACA